MKKFTLTDPKKILEAIKDPRTIITKLSVSMKNENKVHGPMTDEGFEISKDLIQAMFKKMRKANADRLDLSFNEIGKLMGYNIVITMTSPTYKPPLLERIVKKLL